MFMHSSFLPDHLSAASYKCIGQLLPCTIALEPFYTNEHFVRTSWMKRRCEVITAPLAWHYSGKAFCPQIRDENKALKSMNVCLRAQNVVKVLKDIVSWRQPLSISPIRAFGHQRWWGRPNMSHCSGGYILKGFFSEAKSTLTLGLLSGVPSEVSIHLTEIITQHAALFFPLKRWTP